MATATTCDKCKKVIDGEVILPTELKTDDIELGITFSDSDWCVQCSKKALAVAGLALWDRNKNARQVAPKLAVAA